MSAVQQNTQTHEPSPAALEISDLSKRYGPRWAVARLNYSLPAGQSLLLTGHNGSGKSTLLRMIATSASPTHGHIRVFGLDVVSQREDVRRQVGLLSHASFLYEDLTAEENLVLLGRFMGIPNAFDTAQSLLSRVGLKARSQNPVRQYSAGMRKRLAIARLLMKAPKLALLDEPFGELDPSGIQQMEEIIVSLRESGTTLILATHLIEQGKMLTQQHLHLSEGRQVSE